MLQRFLSIVQNGEIQSHLELAQKLGVSPFMVLQMARDLSRRGYLNEFDADCFAQESTCPSCSVGAACQLMGRTWSLTEKGKKVLKPN
jgi:hypothetical protein